MSSHIQLRIVLGLINYFDLISTFRVSKEERPLPHQLERSSSLIKEERLNFLNWCGKGLQGIFQGKKAQKPGRKDQIPNVAIVLSWPARFAIQTAC